MPQSCSEKGLAECVVDLLDGRNVDFSNVRLQGKKMKIHDKLSDFRLNVNSYMAMSYNSASPHRDPKPFYEILPAELSS